jgi:hypothetical protein
MYMEELEGLLLLLLLKLLAVDNRVLLNAFMGLAEA